MVIIKLLANGKPSNSRKDIAYKLLILGKQIHIAQRFCFSFS